MKAHTEIGGVPPLILTSTLDGFERSDSHVGRFMPGKEFLFKSRFIIIFPSKPRSSKLSLSSRCLYHNYVRYRHQHTLHISLSLLKLYSSLQQQYVDFTCNTEFTRLFQQRSRLTHLAIAGGLDTLQTASCFTRWFAKCLIGYLISGRNFTPGT
jgi:hypothetical protein